MRTYKLTIAYDGSRYQGWQRQSKAVLLKRTDAGFLWNCWENPESL